MTSHASHPAHAIGYVRVSTEDQAREGVSLDAQEARIRAWCAERALPVASIHVDAGISGARADTRPALQAALSEAQAGSVLVVYAISRLSRSTIDALLIEARLREAGATLHSLSESYDLASASGRMVFRLMCILAEFEREQLAERTAGAMRHMRDRGQRLGTLPYGYGVAEDGRTLVPDESEQRVLALARAMRAEGLSLRRISAALAELGCLSRSGQPFQPRSLARMLDETP